MTKSTHSTRFSSDQAHGKEGGIVVKTRQFPNVRLTVENLAKKKTKSFRKFGFL
jgi:hypothetical protein